MSEPYAKRSAWSWALYDWANSAFATTVLAVFFPLFFKRHWSAGVDSSLSTAWLGYANAFGSLVIVAVAPMLGAIADAGGLRKKLLSGFALAGLLATGALWFVSKGDWLTALLLFVAASVSWMGGNIFYDSLLVNVAPVERRDWVSSLGFSLGYLGGGLLLAANIAMALRPELFGLPDRAGAVRAAFASVAVWWAVFSLPLVLFVAEPRARTKAARAVRGGLRQLATTLRQIRKLRVVSLFLAAYWLYIDGVDTIIKMAVTYGLDIGLPENALMVALLITQFIGFPATLVFGKLGERLGSKRAILVAIAVYVVVAIVAAGMESASTFYALAAAIGLVQGGVQALSRSLYSRIIPPSQATEFFGFYNMLGKFAAVFGPLMMGVVSQLTASPRLTILPILVLLLAGGALLLRVDEVEGARVAERIERGD